MRSNCAKPTGPHSDEVSLLVSRRHELVRIQTGCLWSVYCRPEAMCSYGAGLHTTRHKVAVLWNELPLSPGAYLEGGRTGARPPKLSKIGATRCHILRLKLGTCESEIFVRIESRIESAATIRIESRIESGCSRLRVHSFIHYA